MSIGIRDLKENWVYKSEKADYVRLIYRILNDRVYYHAFRMNDGNYIGSESCTLKTFTSKVTKEFSPAIHRYLDIEAAEKSRQKRRNDLHQTLAPLTDNDLLEELLMRGIQLEGTE